MNDLTAVFPANTAAAAMSEMHVGHGRWDRAENLVWRGLAAWSNTAEAGWRRAFCS